ncbi:leucine--tRNA ligase [Striga asiatica]|uniref:Leucine--tRNA ligase n=1 Tax=Striga asiatica TaxID=4170 RepID=A0A5A7NY42_STRAF|nr:leucine--tRNA ligase [Striga asiatica]
MPQLCVPRDQTVLGTGIEDRLHEPQTGPRDENCEQLDLHVPAFQCLPWVISPSPSNNGSCLKIEYQQHPQPIEAPEDVPECSLLDKSGRMWGRSISTPGDLTFNRDINRRNNIIQETKLFTGRGYKKLACVFINVVIENVIELQGHVVIYVAQTLWGKAQVSGLTPYEKIKAYIQKLTPLEIGVVAVGQADLGPLPQVGAPGGVIFEKLEAEAAEDAGVEAVGGGGRRLESHLGVGEVEDEVLPLVPDVVVLEAEEEAEPVEEVHGVAPRVERRLAEVAGGAEGGGGGAHLGVAEGRVVGEARIAAGVERLPAARGVHGRGPGSGVAADSWHKSEFPAGFFEGCQNLRNFRED